MLSLCQKLVTSIKFNNLLKGSFQRNLRLNNTQYTTLIIFDCRRLLNDATRDTHTALKAGEMDDVEALKTPVIILTRYAILYALGFVD